MMTDKEYGDTPLPYKGMNVREEIASRIIGPIMSHPIYSNLDLEDERVAVKILKTTRIYTERLITMLNNKQ